MNLGTCEGSLEGSEREGGGGGDGEDGGGGGDGGDGNGGRSTVEIGVLGEVKKDRGSPTA
jgi:hypothetical protein